MRVIELAHIMAGPVCGLMLADLGADVIKVEKAGGGDDSRRFVPPDIKGEPAAFLMMNRNKRGIALDLKSEQGKQVLKRLIKDADVLIENYRRTTMERLGLGYEELKKINPGLIYCEISGFGRTGPYKDRAGFDLIAQGMSGLMDITGEADRGPVKVGAPISDTTAGILGAMGCLAAYAHKQKTGEGQRVDTSLFEAAIMHTYWQSAICFATGESPGRMGTAHPLNAPYQTFRTKDGWVNIGAANQRNWERLLECLGAPELGEDPRFSRNSDRMANQEALVEVLSVYLEKQTTRDWLDALEDAGIPAGPVLTIKEMQADPQTIAREMVPETDHPVAGRVQAIGLPVKLSATPGGVVAPAPLFGQHTREVLVEAGYSSSEIAALLESGGVIADDTISEVAQ
jgi:crotonobetainyl-CoA:carnitine CoA-transferase CaiB-like acyl-CoA transferase